MTGQTPLSARRYRGYLPTFALLLLAVSILSAPLFAQTAGKAMSKNDVIGLLEGGVPSEKIQEAAQKYGIAFEMSAKTETELRDAGAEADLIALLRRLAPRPAAIPKPSATGPAILMVEVTPGGAQVYVDDEPLGTTSQAGRLKLSQLPPGPHTVRVSIAGHRDLEQSVDLEAGKTALVSGALVAASAPTPVNPLAGGGTRRNPVEEPPSPAPDAGASGGEPGALGVQVATTAPAGTRGAYINAVGPGSPAEEAGLRAGQSIVGINGRAINSSEELLQLVPTYRAGQIVQISYMEGGTVHTTRAKLARRVAPPASTTPSVPGGVNPLAPQPSGIPARTMPVMPTVTYTASHDHGQSGQNYCTGVLTAGGGRVSYRGNNSAHVFDFGVDEIKEAKKNGVYLVNLGAFHIRLKSGPNYNFVLLNASGQYQPADELLRAIAVGMGK